MSTWATGVAVAGLLGAMVVGWVIAELPSPDDIYWLAGYSAAVGVLFTVVLVVTG